MVRIILIFVTVLFMAFPAMADGQAYFFTEMQDVPLMPGLHELGDQTIVFDKPEGRIVESYAQAESVTQSDIEAFYAQALPQFGWSRLGKNSYARQNEVLEFYVEMIDGEKFLKVMVKPAG